VQLKYCLFPLLDVFTGETLCIKHSTELGLFGVPGLSVKKWNKHISILLIMYH
jgi:hypothetical protein